MKQQPSEVASMLSWQAPSCLSPYTDCTTKRTQTSTTESYGEHQYSAKRLLEQFCVQQLILTSSTPTVFQPSHACGHPRVHIASTRCPQKGGCTHMRVETPWRATCSRVLLDQRQLTIQPLLHSQCRQCDTHYCSPASGQRHRATNAEPSRVRAANSRSRLRVAESRSHLDRVGWRGSLRALGRSGSQSSRAH